MQKNYFLLAYNDKIDDGINFKAYIKQRNNIF